MKYGVQGTRARCAGVLKGTESVLAKCQHESMKRKKSKKERDKAALAAVIIEMDRPRFVESARQEEATAGHRVTNHKK
jgi:hypothetical protein